MICSFWFLSLIAIAAAQCPPNSLHLDNNDTVCYSFHSRLSKFASAQTHCKSFGAQLVSLKNEYINSYIAGYANLIFDEVVFFWSGGNRLHDPSQLEWSNGEKLEYTHFHKNEVSKNGSCLAADVNQGFWKNENCFAELSYVCEFFAGKNIIPDNADQLDLDGGTTETPDTITVVTDTPQEYDHTVDFNFTEPTEQQTDFTVPFATDSEHISSTSTDQGLQTTPTNQELQTTPTDQGLQTVSDISEYTTTLNPNTDKNNGDEEKSDATVTVNNEEIFSTGSTFLNADEACPQGYHHHVETDQCYKLNTLKTTWEDAEEICIKEGGHLASIENEVENNFVVEFVTKQYSVEKCNEDDQPWIGFNRLVNDVDYLWSDGSVANYTNWATLYSEPNNLGGNQKCAELFSFHGCKFEVGSWNDLNCTMNHTFLCKQAAKNAFAPRSLLCPLGWEYNKDTKYCYMLNSELTTWEDAEAACQKEDAHLASVCDENENAFITELIALQSSNSTCNTSLQTWIGLSKLADNTTWCWIDGNESQFTKWSKHNREPNNLNDNQFCVQIFTDSGCAFKSGDWNDIECNSTQKAVCKKPAATIPDQPYNEKSAGESTLDEFNTTPENDLIIQHLTN